ncbi:MAG: hypothetical protein H6905_02570 [Hyphomicrobiales bacterium]|nr:hypothetical protein [Hyphomicrobiales bacterium]
MITLNMASEPHWLDLGHGVRVHVKPCTTAVMMAARAEVQRNTVADLSEPEAAGLRAAELIKTLGKLAILDWEGVGGVEGEPLAITPNGIDALLDLWPMADAFERFYLGPVLLLDDEKNA